MPVSSSEYSLSPEMDEDSYNSFFDRIDFEKGTRPIQEFSGSFNSLVSEISQALEKEDPLLIIGRLPQLLRPILPLKQQYPGNADAYYAFVYATQAIQYAYSSNFAKSKECVDKCIDHVSKLADPDQLQVVEKADAASWLACKPEYSQRSVDTIASNAKSGDIIFIPLANGGTRPGFDVYLRYIEQTQSKGSTIFPVRFSRLKNKDTAPQVTTADLEYMRKKVEQGASIVIFEEDSDTKITSDQAHAFFQEKFPEAPVISVTNYDSLTDW